MKNNKRIIRILIALMTLCLAVGIIPAFVMNAGAADLNASTWSELSSGLQTANATVHLMADIMAEGSITVANNVTLDMNGRSILYAMNGNRTANGTHWSNRPSSIAAWIPYMDSASSVPLQFFVVGNGVTFTISGEGHIGYSHTFEEKGDNRNDGYIHSRIVKVNSGGTLNINGATLACATEMSATDGYAHCVGAMAVPVHNNGGTVNIYSGTIAATSRADGNSYKSSETYRNSRPGMAYSDALSIPVYSASGTVNMYGGTIYSWAKGDNENTSTTGLYGYDGDYGSECAYSVCVDCQSGGTFNMYGGTIRNEGAYDWNDKEDDGLHYSIAFGINYTGTNMPKIVGGQISTSYLSGQTTMTSKTNVGKVTCSKADIGKVTLGLSVNGDNNGTVSYDTNAKWKNEYGKIYTKVYTQYGNGSGQQNNNTVADTVLYGGMTDGKKARVIYRLYNANGTRIETNEYYTGNVTKVLASIPSLNGMASGSGSNTGSSTAGGEWKYSGSCGTGSCGFVNDSYAYAGSTTIKYLKQAASAAYPDINTAGAAGSATSLNADQMMYIFIDVKLRPTDTPIMTLQGSQIEYQGGAVVPAILTGTNYDTSAGDFGIRIEPNEESRTDITTSAFNWKSGMTTGKQDVTYSYTGTSSGSGLPSEPGTYTVTASLAGTAPNSNWSTYPGPAGANINAKSAECSVTIAKRNPNLACSARTMTYGETLGSKFGCGTSVPAGASFSAGTRIACSPEGEFHWFNTSGQNIDNVILNAGSNQTVKLRWTPKAGTVWANRFEEKEISVNLNVNKAPLTISAKDLEMTYGAEYQFAYSDFDWSGIVNTSVDSEQSLFNAINAIITVGDRSCTAGKKLETENSVRNTIGTYDWGFPSVTLQNYEVTSESGIMTVNKREITATAYANPKPYDGNVRFVVGFNLDFDPVAEMESIAVADATGIGGSANVGTTTIQQINLLNTDTKINEGYWNQLLTGAKKANYNLSVTNSPNITGADAIVATVTRAAAEITDPTVSSVVYDHNKTLVDQFCPSGNNFICANTGTAGHWEWKNPGDVPSVADTSAVAVFIPNNETNFDRVEREVAITVTKREITVGVSAPEITYYEPAPALTYTFSGFTDDEKIEGNPEALGGYVNQGVTGLAGNIGVNHGYTVGSDAGSYAIGLTVTLTSDNYSFVAAEGCALTVRKAELTVKANDRSIVYGTANPGYTKTITGFKGEDTWEVISGYSAMQFSCDYQAGALYGGVGEYNIIPVTGTLSATNYSFVPVNGTLTVTPATLTVKATDTTIGYGETTVNRLGYEFSGFVGGDGETDVRVIAAPAIEADGYSVDAATSTYSPAGTYTIVINNTDWFAIDNYVFETRTGTLTVLQAETEIVVDNLTATIDFEQTLEEADFNGNIIAVSHGTYCTGTFAFADPSIQPDWNDREADEDGGNSTLYTIIFTPYDTNCRPVTVQKTIRINRRHIEGEPIISGSIMDGGIVMADVTAMVPSSSSRYFFEWSIDGEVVGEEEEYTIRSTDVGKYLTLTVTVDTSYPYDGSATTTSEYPISELLPTITAEQVADIFDVNWENKVYDGAPNTATATNKGVAGVGAPTVRYNNSVNAPVQAGTYRITLDIGQGTAYAPASGLYVGEMTISKRDLAVTFGVNDKQYDAKVNATRDTGVDIGYTNKVDGDDISVSFDAATIKFADANVGTDKVVTVSGVIATGLDKKNYNIVVDDSVTANITPKTITTKARPVARTYDPADNEVEVTFTTLSGVLSADRGLVSIGSYEAVLAANDAGTENISSISAILTGTKAGNYVVSITNADGLTAVINKAEATAIPGFAVPSPAAVAYNAQTLSAIGLPSNWSWADGSVKISVTNTGYAAVYTPTDTRNYKNYTATVPLNVSKRALTVAYKSYAITYGDEVPALEYTISGYAQGENFGSFGGAIVTSCTYVKNLSVGTYDIASSASSTFYNVNYDVTYVPGVITVGPKTIEATGTATGRAYRSGNTNVDVIYTLNNAQKVRNNDDVYLSWNYGTGTLASADAGFDKPVTVTPPVLEGSSAGNYTLVFTNSGLTVNITKAVPSGYSFPSAATIVFGKPLGQATFTTTGSGAGTFRFADADEYPAAVGYFPNAYEVVFTPSDTNYSTVTKRIPLTVTRAKIVPVVTLSGSMFVGETISATLTGLEGTARNYIHYKWYRVTASGAEIEIGEDRPTYVLTDDDVDCNIKVSISIDDTAPYYIDENSAAGTTSSTAKPVQQENLTLWQRIWKWWNRIMTAIRRLLKITG